MPDVLDLTCLDLNEPGGTARMAEALRRQGMATFHGVPCRAELLSAGRALMRIRTHRDSDADGVTTIQQRITFAATGSLAGFTDRELLPHTDGSAVTRPPQVLMLAGVRQPRTGGQVLLVDGGHLYDEIAENDQAMLTAIRAPHSAYFGAHHPPTDEPKQHRPLTLSAGRGPEGAETWTLPCTRDARRCCRIPRRPRGLPQVTTLVHGQPRDIALS